MGALALVWLFARSQFLRSLALRRCWLLLVLGFLPALVAALLARYGRRVDASGIAQHLGWFLELQVVVPLVTLLAGSAVIAREVEDRTITYLFSRPVPRPAMFLGRTLGALAFAWLIALAGTIALLLAAGQAAPGKRLDPDSFPLALWSSDGVSLPLLQAVSLGALAYTLVFSALGVFTRYPMIVGLAYCFAIEGFLSNLPGSNQALTVQYYLRSWIAGHGAASWRGLEGFGGTSFEAPGGVLAKLALVVALALALGAWRIRRKEFVLSS